MKRSRGRGRRQQNPVNRSYDSNGPDVRVRGTASQVYEKYQALARDATSSGDRVMAENYQQHAEHYYRIMLSFQPAPGEADKEAANGDANADADERSDNDGNGEPLVLMRGSGDSNGDTDADEKPSKPSRRRGPLRKKQSANGNASDATASKDDAAAQTDSDENGAAPHIAEIASDDGDSEAAITE